jgi:hypothetical protein
MITGREKSNTQGKDAPILLCPSKIFHAPPLD